MKEWCDGVQAKAKHDEMKGEMKGKKDEMLA